MCVCGYVDVKLQNFLIFALFYEPLDIVLTWTQWTSMKWTFQTKFGWLLTKNKLLSHIQEIIKDHNVSIYGSKLLNCLLFVCWKKKKNGSFLRKNYVYSRHFFRFCLEWSLSVYISVSFCKRNVEKNTQMQIFMYI